MSSILVVDDENQIRLLVRETLEQAGHHVTEARDGKEALQQYRLAPVDLVIMDILMPNQDGLETTVSLRREFPDVKIIVITGGSSAMQGMVELGEEVFHMPVRLGLPQYMGSLSEVMRNPRYSTGVGLLMAGLGQHQRQQLAKMHSGSFKQVIDRMRRWFEANF